MAVLFDHEKLEVYQHAVQFVALATDFLNEIPKSASIHNQLDRASTSIPLNIAEGNGKWTKKDRCRFFDIAHGSALECAAALDIAVAKQFLNQDQANEGKHTLGAIVRMLVGLIKANDPDREFGNFQTVKEDGVEYLMPLGGE